MGLFDEIKGELEAFSCSKKLNWPKSDTAGGGVPWRNAESGGVLRAIGSRQHAFKTTWEQSLDPQGINKGKGKSDKTDEIWSIDWKKWPPNIPKFPKGVKIPVALVPQIDLRLSLSGRWDEITNGTTVVPVNYASKKFFENLGGHLNVAQSISFKVIPTSLLFLHSKVGQFYSVKLKLHNSGNNPRRVRILPPANSCFTVIRHAEPEDAVSPGCNLTVTVQYRPKTNDSLNDVVVFHVDRDGAIVVPLISSCAPEPILEVEEWNCGCCVVGIPRTAHFEIKNVGGEGRFWILSEKEFNNEYLDCYLKFKKDLIKESTREIVKIHTDAMDGKDSNVRNASKKTLIGRGEASGLIKRKKDSLDDDMFSNFKNFGKIQPRIVTKCFRIQPSCFKLQKNQKVSIKVRYLPNDANFHYEKLCIMCENGEVRWIAVKGLGIDRDSDRLIEIKARCTAPPVDLPSDPRTKYIMDCGDLITGELAKLHFSIVNKSCIPLYFFWSIRPLLTDPEASPDNTELKLMERFYESTIFNVDVTNLNFTGNADEDMREGDENLKTFTTLLPLTVSPAQGMLEKKQEMKMTFTTECPMSLGYHACVISLFVEQVDEDSKHTVLQTLKKLDKDQLSRPISHANLRKELPQDSDGSSVFSNKEEKVLFKRNSKSPPLTKPTESTLDQSKSTFRTTGTEASKSTFRTQETQQSNRSGFPTTDPTKASFRTTQTGGAGDQATTTAEPSKATLQTTKAGPSKTATVGTTEPNKYNVHTTEASKATIHTIEPSHVGNSEATENEDDFLPLKETIKEVQASLQEAHTSVLDNDVTKKPSNEMILPLSVAKRVSTQLIQNGKQSEMNIRNRDQQTEKGRHSKEVGKKSYDSGGDPLEKKDSINVHILKATSSTENDREMGQGHGVYEDLKLYTESVIPQYQMWPNRDKTLTPVAEVEIWLHSVPLNVQFSPPFIVVTGLVKTSIERLIKVKNGTGHNLEMDFENISDDPTGAITCHPSRFSVRPFETKTFKVTIYFQRYGEMQKLLRGTITLPFTKLPCFLSTYMKAIGPFLEVLTPTLNFGIVPLSSETMKTLAFKNGGDRPLKWVARIAPDGMQDENNREISGHQARIHDKRLVRVWPEWGVLEPKETAGTQVYFSAELSGEIATYVEVMVEGNPQSIISVPVYAQIELPSLVLENGVITFSADDFPHHQTQSGSCSIINPTGFNVPYVWQCPVGRHSKLCGVYIHPKKGIIPAKERVIFSVSVETYVRDEPLDLDNLFVPCCVEGMREPLILKIITE